MRCDARVYTQVRQCERQHAPISPAGDEGVRRQLERAYERGVAVEHRGALSVRYMNENQFGLEWTMVFDLPCLSVPYTHCRVQPPRGNDLAVKGDRVYLVEMSAENL